MIFLSFKKDFMKNRHSNNLAPDYSTYEGSIMGSQGKGYGAY